MQQFRYIRAHNVEHAATLLLQHDGRARILAGGTDLIVALRERRLETELVIDIKGIPEVSELSFDPDDGLRIGASVPCYRIYNDATVAGKYPGLIDAASLIGGIQIQGRASLGGNVCNASPAADSLPALIVHGAICDIALPQTRRRVPVEAFCTAPGKTVLERGEFLASLHLPPPPSGFGAAYLRFIPRNEMDIAVVGVGASLQLDERRQRITAARIALARSRRPRSLCRRLAKRWSARSLAMRRLRGGGHRTGRGARPSPICAARPNTGAISSAYSPVARWRLPSSGPGSREKLP